MGLCNRSVAPTVSSSPDTPGGMSTSVRTPGRAGGRGRGSAHNRRRSGRSRSARCRSRLKRAITILVCVGDGARQSTESAGISRH
jgi:hypothetical protein